MSALLPSDEDVISALKGGLTASENIGIFPDVSRKIRALIAAWNRRTAPVGAWSREDGPHPAYALAAKVCRERAKYYDDTKGHVDRDQIARSYRATADEIERLDLTPEGLSVVIHDALPTQEDVARVIRGVYGVGVGTFAGGEQDDSIMDAAARIIALMGQTGDGGDHA